GRPSPGPYPALLRGESAQHHLSCTAWTETPLAHARGGKRRGEPMAPLVYRGAQIRTGDLSDPNGARYQAAPHPEPSKRSAARSGPHPFHHPGTDTAHLPRYVA